MEQENLSTYAFNTNIEAEEAFRSLGRSGFDVKKLYLISLPYQCLPAHRTNAQGCV